jgi:hypothetical protein
MENPEPLVTPANFPTNPNLGQLWDVVKTVSALVPIEGSLYITVENGELVAETEDDWKRPVRGTKEI